MRRKSAILLVLVITLLATSWYYFVGSQNRTEDNSKIGSSKTATIIAVGDIACNPNDEFFNSGQGRNGICQHRAVAEAIKKEQADALLLLGDLQYSNGDFDEFEKSFVPAFQSINLPMVSAAGNHEYQRGNANGYLRAFRIYFPKAKYLEKDKTYFATNIGKWRILVLDSNCEYVGGCNAGSAQYAWLKKELTSSPRCTLAMWHHPVVTSGAHQELKSTQRMKESMVLLQQSKVDVVLAGHDHNYERFGRHLADGTPDASGVRSFVVGTGGQRLYNFKTQLQPAHQVGFDNTYGYLKMTLNPGSYDWQFIDTSSKALDGGSDNCS